MQRCDFRQDLCYWPDNLNQLLAMGKNRAARQVHGRVFGVVPGHVEKTALGHA